MPLELDSSNYVALSAEECSSPVQPEEGRAETSHGNVAIKGSLIDMWV